ncbi:hypothetical protein [Paraurantiacibacter namhicola]|uniref:SmpA / OmlA family protein n=1 Tax=Paraurantiacibacter namhicola TaxID=645517 RepID=A0A1C7D622_9SPHN|nr:hypothetical protein [Paraurantiacibacter namhicola]ANU06802.1 hypothetical protein A6F65_00477 [Paraurantiacibacter namhicola]
MRAKIALLLTPLAAACASVPDAPQQARPVPPRPEASRPPPQQSVTPAAPAGFLQPQVLRMRGLEDVIERDRAALVGLFGTPRLDVVEGDARKLQFSGEACVLDVYLYPMSPGAEPVATYVDARRYSDGLDVDRAACVEALRQR